MLCWTCGGVGCPSCRDSSVQVEVPCSRCYHMTWVSSATGAHPSGLCNSCKMKDKEKGLRVTHLCDVDVRNRPEEQPTLCGIREPVGSWNPPHKADLSAKGICQDCVQVFKVQAKEKEGVAARGECRMCRQIVALRPDGRTDFHAQRVGYETCHGSTLLPLTTKGQNVQHIIALQNSRTALCGLPRDRIVQSGDGGICPDCKEVDKHIQQAIGYLADPIVKGPFQRLLNQFSKPETAAGPAAAAATKVIEQKMDYKTSAVKALKRGAAAGTMKVVSKKIKAKLTDKFPQLAMVPDNIWNVVLCLAINMVASSSPDIPGIRMAEQLSSEAFEGLLTDATSKMVQDVIETVSETFVELAEDRKHKGLLGCEE